MPTIQPAAGAGPDADPDADNPGPVTERRSYPSEWALFCDYTAATGQPTLPTTVEALTGFLTALPAAPATLARRVRAVAAAHRRDGHLLERPANDPALAPKTAAAGPAAMDRHRRIESERATRDDAGVDVEVEAGRLLAACPMRGWTAGLWGRRDAFLIVLTAHLGYTHDAARTATTADVAFEVGDDDEPVAVVGGDVVPSSDDARTCATCAVVRWLEVLGDLDGLGRGSARMTLTAAHAPTARSHRHSPSGVERWRGAAQLLPAVDQHGWHDDYQPMTTRAVRTRLSLARARGEAHEIPGEPLSLPDAEPSEMGKASDAHHRLGDLNEVLGALDELADDADALNDRIQALLDHR